jgi:hypothetical protein
MPHNKATHYPSEFIQAGSYEQTEAEAENRLGHFGRTRQLHGV